jgi:quercetin dioxygenase-like cupin family protein
MTQLRSALLVPALLLLVCCTHPAVSTATPPTTAGEHLEVWRAGSQPSTTGASANFAGKVVVTPLFRATEHTRASGGSVAFEPGAHSVWHSHPAGQTLIVTAGTGWVQEWGGKKVEMRPGDVVWTPPGVKHWHGATATEAMTHIAIQERVDGSVVTWMEAVTEEQYRSEEEPR